MSDFDKEKILAFDTEKLNKELDKHSQEGVEDEKRILNPITSDFIEMTESEGCWRGTLKLKNQNDFDLDLSFFFSCSDVKMNTSARKIKRKSTFAFQVQLTGVKKNFFIILIAQNKKKTKSCSVISAKWNNNLD